MRDSLASMYGMPTCAAESAVAQVQYADQQQQRDDALLERQELLGLAADMGQCVQRVAAHVFGAGNNVAGTRFRP